MRCHIGGFYSFIKKDTAKAVLMLIRISGASSLPAKDWIIYVIFFRAYLMYKMLSYNNGVII